MMALSDYESLSREERLRRIGALLSKAVTLRLIREQALRESEINEQTAREAPDTVNPQAIAVLEAETLEADSSALLLRFAMLAEVAPREATQFWNTSRTTAYRRLLRLLEAGWLVRHGATTASRFRYTAKAIRFVQANDRQSNASIRRRNKNII